MRGLASIRPRIEVKYKVVASDSVKNENCQIANIAGKSKSIDAWINWHGKRNHKEGKTHGSEC